MTTQLHIVLYYAANVPKTREAELAAITNIHSWLKEVKDDFIKAGGIVHYEIGPGLEHRIFLENINNELAERAFLELDKHRHHYV